MSDIDERCPVCGYPVRPIPGYESRTVYCSPRCEDRAWRRRRKADTERLRAENETARAVIHMREVENCCPDLQSGWWLKVGLDLTDWPRVREITDAERALLASIEEVDGE